MNKAGGKGTKETRIGSISIHSIVTPSPARRSLGRALQTKQELAQDTSSSLEAAKWIWYPKGNPAAAAPVGKRYFRRVVKVDAGSRIESAQLVMTADNSFVCWINGQWAGAGDSFTQTYVMNVTSLIKPGVNVVAVAAVNGADAPNPAGLIGTLVLKYRNGRTLEVPTDGTWQTAMTVEGKWTSATAHEPRWRAALELGAFGMPPWGNIEQTPIASHLFPEVATICGLLEKTGVPPDFSYRTGSSAQSLRYIHRTIGGNDVYFIANKTPRAEEAVCCFRVHGRHPELWWPETGRIEPAAVYDEADGGLRLPLRLDPSGSVFVVFRAGTAIEADRITSVTRNGQPVLPTTLKAGSLPSDRSAAGSIAVTRRAAGGIEADVRQPGSYVLRTADGHSRRLDVASLPDPQAIAGPWEVRFASAGAHRTTSRSID